MGSVQNGVRNSAAWKGILLHLCFWFSAIVFWELMLHFAAFGTPGLRFGYVLGFSFAFACVLAVVTSVLPKKASFWMSLAIAVFLIIMYGSQMVYFFVFGNLYSVSQIQQGGMAVTSFWRETLVTMWEHLPWLLSLLVPLVVLVVLRKFAGGIFVRSNLLWAAAVAAAAVVCMVAVILYLPAGGTGYFTDYYFYHNENTTTDQATERFGLLTAFRLDLSGTNQEPEEKKNTYQIQEALPAEPQVTTPEGEVEEAPKTEYNVLNIDFDALNAGTTDETLLALNRYIESLTGTNKNEYTGMLSDYNLIVLCAEAFATGAIHEELTPTLYRLSQEGIIFNNFYNTYPNNTTDGEYTLCMGLYPDITRSKATASFYASRNSYLPFCLGNIFEEQRGIKSYGYHSHIGSYYGRDESHPNMGYEMKFGDSGLDVENVWPASDLEMMEKSIDDYLSADKQFHAYYMTFSGHLMYQPGHNAMADKNWGLVKDLEGYDVMTKCYLACHIELDRALEYMMQRLEEAGVADKTAIVVVGDHYPYGLYDYQYSDLVGYEVDAFTKSKSTALFWVGGLEENIVVDEYCCNADMLPTILNLWGFDFDSRLMTGTDVFSDGTHIAVLRDMSFFTDKVWLNANTGEIRYQVDESEIPEGYVESMIQLVQNKYALSADILNKAYYNYVFAEGNVTVNRDAWGADPDAAVVVPEETEATQPPETQAPETQPPATQPPETQAPETQPPATQPPETQAPETQPPATQPPETQAPEMQPPQATQPPAQEDSGEV